MFSTLCQHLASHYPGRDGTPDLGNESWWKRQPQSGCSRCCRWSSFHPDHPVVFLWQSSDSARSLPPTPAPFPPTTPSLLSCDSGESGSNPSPRGESWRVWAHPPSCGWFQSGPLTKSHPVLWGDMWWRMRKISLRKWLLKSLLLVLPLDADVRPGSAAIL